jgi:hypothetical protein
MRLIIIIQSSVFLTKHLNRGLILPFWKLKINENIRKSKKFKLILSVIYDIKKQGTGSRGKGKIKRLMLVAKK